MIFIYAVLFQSMIVENGYIRTETLAEVPAAIERLLVDETIAFVHSPGMLAEPLHGETLSALQPTAKQTEAKQIAKAVLEAAMPQLAEVHDVVLAWKQRERRLGRYVLSEGMELDFIRAGGTKAHTDAMRGFSYIAPVSLSLGIEGSALFRAERWGSHLRGTFGLPRPRHYVAMQRRMEQLRNEYSLHKGSYQFGTAALQTAGDGIWFPFPTQTIHATTLIKETERPYMHRRAALFDYLLTPARRARTTVY
jgi:hypothetical protein